MPFGGEDVQAVERDDVFVLCVALLFEVLEDVLVGLFGDSVERVEVVEVAILLVLDEALFALGQALGNLFGEALLPGHELGVAAEQAVGAGGRPCWWRS